MRSVPNITLNGATLTEASKYTDSEGNLELAADVNLEFDSRITTVDTSTIPDFSIDESTRSLPNLRGYGVVYNSFISYNVNPDLKALAEELTTDLDKTANGFESFLESWSGYDAA